MSAADKARDKVQVAMGQAKEATGKALGSLRLKLGGKGEKVAGNLKQAGEKVKDAIGK